MLQNACKTLGFKKNMVYKIPPGGGGKPYPASGLSNSGFDRTFMPCSGYSLRAAEQRAGYQISWVNIQSEEKLSVNR